MPMFYKCPTIWILETRVVIVKHTPPQTNPTCFVNTKHSHQKKRCVLQKLLKNKCRAGCTNVK